MAPSVARPTRPFKLRFAELFLLLRSGPFHWVRPGKKGPCTASILSSLEMMKKSQ